MPRDAYYNSRHWKQLREAALLGDLYRCAVPGCRPPAFGKSLAASDFFFPLPKCFSQREYSWLMRIRPMH
jgi:hypothetical protein